MMTNLSRLCNFILLSLKKDNYFSQTKKMTNETTFIERKKNNTCMQI